MNAILLLSKKNTGSYQIEFANKIALSSIDLKIKNTVCLPLFTIENRLEEKQYTVLEAELTNGSNFKQLNILYNVNVCCIPNFTKKNNPLYCLTYQIVKSATEAITLKKFIHDINNSITELSFGFDLIEPINPESEIPESIAIALTRMKNLTNQLESYYEKL